MEQLLFSDKETFVKERPKKVPETRLQKFYTDLAEEIKSEGYSDDDIETIVEDVKEMSTIDNGYEIAKHLDDRGNASYDIDPMFVDFLDNYGWRRREVFDEIIKEWVKIHDIKPKFNKGDKLIANEYLNRDYKSNAIVYVTGIKSDTARYLIDADPNRNGGTVFDFEKVETICSLI